MHVGDDLKTAFKVGAESGGNMGWWGAVAEASSPKTVSQLQRGHALRRDIVWAITASTREEEHRSTPATFGPGH